MSGPVLSAEEMLAWNERTAEGWRRMAAQIPEMLLIPCDIYGTATVGQLLQHIVVVELRYAQRLAGLAETAYEDVPYATAEEIFAVHDGAMDMVRKQLAGDMDWELIVGFKTRAGAVLRVSRKTILVHLLMHSIRHYAQLATLVRQHGFTPDWGMDYLLMGVEKKGWVGGLPIPGSTSSNLAQPHPHPHPGDTS